MAAKLDSEAKLFLLVKLMGWNCAGIAGFTLGALGTLFLLVLVATSCLCRRRRQSMSLTSHIRLGATGDLPVFNTRGTERFETSSMSLSFGPNSEYDSTLGETRVARFVERRSDRYNAHSPGDYHEVVNLPRCLPLRVRRDQSSAVTKCKNLGQINAFLSDQSPVHCAFLKALGTPRNKSWSSWRPQVCDLNKARIALETTQGLAYLYAPNPWCCSTT
ncbi:hypothetical protein KXD40_007188 [Peronospora effusa]|uniref:Uncharacterized protein n=1 Tax=Peronospora effusa TaxID=542832 RepID=A0A3M6VE53_9STRA|nr:hypothetical protein DD238_005743 [Peronospora effusa]RQM14529.1 hypothetical protein DD237_003162 [Peronospora effusa]UIZ28731.1 hypothetical protein KXD40_007188 [Peronospora effusa]